MVRWFSMCDKLVRWFVCGHVCFGRLPLWHNIELIFSGVARILLFVHPVHIQLCRSTYFQIEEIQHGRGQSDENDSGQRSQIR
jgi:hypothetical protein